MDFSLRDVPLYPDSFSGVFSDVGLKHVTLPPGFSHGLIMALLFVFLSLYCAVSAVLFYHWHTYGMKNKIIFGAEILFTAVSTVLFTITFVLAINV